MLIHRLPTDSEPSQAIQIRWCSVVVPSGSSRAVSSWASVSASSGFSPRAGPMPAANYSAARSFQSANSDSVIGRRLTDGVVTC